jgi:uncharacterized protein YodC (DUF2158 family)
MQAVFKIGALVKLKSGSPDMTVSFIHEDDTNDGKKGNIDVCYFNADGAFTRLSNAHPDIFELSYTLA